MFYTYIIYSPSIDKYYIGHTGDNPEKRLRKHNSNHKAFTGGVGDWELVYIEKHSDKSSAYKKEREIKGWKSRIKVEKLINSVSSNGLDSSLAGI